ncbi:hypothetical protein B0H19DRAFT_306602 [Mycena capillaripes]|nr:hypothetical protein B0H19DRAFT_306602 [Mycena capillaripes]
MDSAALLLVHFIIIISHPAFFISYPFFLKSDLLPATMNFHFPSLPPLWAFSSPPRRASQSQPSGLDALSPAAFPPDSSPATYSAVSPLAHPFALHIPFAFLPILASIHIRLLIPHLSPLRVLPFPSRSQPLYVPLILLKLPMAFPLSLPDSSPPFLPLFGFPRCYATGARCPLYCLPSIFSPWFTFRTILQIFQAYSVTLSPPIIYLFSFSRYLGLHTIAPVPFFSFPQSRGTHPAASLHHRAPSPHVPILPPTHPSFHRNHLFCYYRVFIISIAIYLPP